LSGKSISLRGKIIDALRAGDFEKVTGLALEDKKTFRILISLAYDKEDLLCWRAIEAIGKAAGAVAEKDPSSVRNIVQRLLWSMGEESGGVGWSAPEMLGEIVIHSTQTCGDIPPILLSFHVEESLIKGVLWAIGRIAGSGVKGMEGASEIALQSLGHKDPSVRGLALYAIRELDFPGAADKVKGMVHDGGRLSIYEEHVLRETTVGDMARRVLHYRGGTEAG